MTDEMPAIGMDENRLRHCHGVGVKASELGRALFGWSDEKCREMFVMGYLHDVGYQFAHEQSEHEELGGDLLRETVNARGGDVRRADIVSGNADPSETRTKQPPPVA